MAGRHMEEQLAPVRRVLRITAVCCLAGAALLILGDWTGIARTAEAGSLLPAALVLGGWAALLSVGLLIGRLRG